MKKVIYLAAFIFVSQFGITKSWASGAGFKVFGTSVELPKEKGSYTVNGQVGQALEIIAKGWAYPRSRDPEARKGTPTKADAGTWMFDDKVFKLLKTESDGAQYKLVLKASAPGQHKVRFVGVVLGYNKACEILVTISEPTEE